MAISIPIQELTKQAFGLSSFPDIGEYDMSKVGLNATGRDQLGRLYFMDVELTSAKLGETWRMPNEPLIRVSKQKNLVETVIAGNEEFSGGIVIEQINKGNFAIDIRGIILNEELTAPQYPQDQVKKLIDFCESGEALEINCQLLDHLFNIGKIVIKDYDIDAMQGQPYSQRYTINCISYTDFYADLSIKQITG